MYHSNTRNINTISILLTIDIFRSIFIYPMMLYISILCSICAQCELIIKMVLF